MMRLIDRGQAVNPILQLGASEVEIKQFIFLMSNVGVAEVFDVIELTCQWAVFERGEALTN